MPNLKAASLWLLIPLVCLAIPSQAGAQTGDIREGQPFPPLTFPALADGSPTTLEQFAGQKLILHVWASW